MTYTFNRTEFIADNQEALSSLYLEYLDNMKEEILEGSFIPKPQDVFNNNIYRLRNTPSETQLLMDGIVWEVDLCQ